MTATLHPAGQLRRMTPRVLPWLVRGLVATAVVAFGFLAIGPHVFGYRTMTMLTGSMAPEIDPGDITVVTPLAVEDVAAGMVIAYHIPIDDHRVVTHRVVAVERGEDGSVTVQTKGDANRAIDPWKARDRKSTRLNSSHANISYAVFCLKKKKQVKIHLHNHNNNTRHTCRTV